MKNITILAIFLLVLSGCSAPDDGYSAGETGGSGSIATGSGGETASGGLAVGTGSSATGGDVSTGSTVGTGGSESGGSETGGAASGGSGTGGSIDCTVTGFSSPDEGVTHPMESGVWAGGTTAGGVLTALNYDSSTGIWSVKVRLDITGSDIGNCYLTRETTITVDSATDQITARSMPYQSSGSCNGIPPVVDEAFYAYFDSIIPVCEAL